MTQTRSDVDLIRQDINESFSIGLDSIGRDVNLALAIRSSFVRQRDCRVLIGRGCALIVSATNDVFQRLESYLDPADKQLMLRVLAPAIQLCAVFANERARIGSKTVLGTAQGAAVGYAISDDGSKWSGGAMVGASYAKNSAETAAFANEARTLPALLQATAQLVGAIPSLATGFQRAYERRDQPLVKLDEIRMELQSRADRLSDQLRVLSRVVDALIVPSGQPNAIVQAIGAALLLGSVFVILGVLLDLTILTIVGVLAAIVIMISYPYQNPSNPERIKADALIRQVRNEVSNAFAAA